MPTDTDLEARAIWQLEQAGYRVTVQANQGYTVTDPNGHPIAVPATRDELRALADSFMDRLSGGAIASRIAWHGALTWDHLCCRLRPLGVRVTPSVLPAYSGVRISVGRNLITTRGRRSL